MNCSACMSVRVGGSPLGAARWVACVAKPRCPLFPLSPRFPRLRSTTTSTPHCVLQGKGNTGVWAQQPSGHAVPVPVHAPSSAGAGTGLLSPLGGFRPWAVGVRVRLMAAAVFFFLLSSFLCVWSWMFLVLGVRQEGWGALGSTIACTFSSPPACSRGAVRACGPRQGRQELQERQEQE
jgi:hypothetical protein